jgi:hypothetical protein
MYTFAAGLLSLMLLFGAQVASRSSEEAQMQEAPQSEEIVPVEVIDLPAENKLHPIQEGQPVAPDLSPGVVDPALQPLIDIVQQDLATNMGIAPWDSEVLEARAVVWPDGSLGCPTPGLAFIQVQVEGALVRLRVGDQVYEYHSGGRRPPFLCNNPIPKPTPSGVPLPPPGGSAGV